MPQTPAHLHHLHHHPRRTVDLRSEIDKYAYCLCLHVKPTTIFIAGFKLIRALLFASILLNTEFAINDQGQEISLSSLDDRHRSTAAAMTILTRIIMGSVSAVGIYAVVSGRAALLIPLYSMLSIDFIFSLPAFYSRDIDSTFEDNYTYQHRGQHPTTHPQYARYSIILFSTVAMILKVYFLCVVYKCYRYLRMIELVTPIGLYPHLQTTGSQYPIVRVLGSLDSIDLSPAHNVTPPPYESVAAGMKPPNYEEAIKSSAAVFTVIPSQNNTDNSMCQPQPQQQSTPLQLQQSQQQPLQQLPQQAQQTAVVFTTTSSEHRQNVSTQVIGPNASITTNIGPTTEDASRNVEEFTRVDEMDRVPTLNSTSNSAKFNTEIEKDTR